ncbi:serine/threonine-protein kinase [Streptomyces sp. NPDC051561]|uniref:serine/threonine-protein kinase n=1 Tax=Streptomyces sp. NPDC051561 TaxID=3365658 RepID=UPI0037A4EB31
MRTSGRAGSDVPPDLPLPQLSPRTRTPCPHPRSYLWPYSRPPRGGPTFVPTAPRPGRLPISNSVGDILSPLGPEDPRETAGYHLLARIGEGGMGTVYLSHTRGNQPVALKVIRREYGQNPDFRRRFEQEVQAARRVQGYHIVPVVDHDTSGTQPWLASSFVPGLALHEVLGHFGPLPEAAVFQLVGCTALALSSIHAAGVVHRDLKPSNILIGSGGPFVIDFGIARAADATQLTASGGLIGTPQYMSPEHALGEQVGPASDIFSLGLIAAVAATGRHPFGDGGAITVAAQIANTGHRPPDLSGYPDNLRPLLERCLTADAADRITPAELMPLCEQLAGRPLREFADWLPEPVTEEIVRREQTAQYAAQQAQTAQAAQAAQAARAAQEAAQSVQSAQSAAHAAQAAQQPPVPQQPPQAPQGPPTHPPTQPPYAQPLPTQMPGHPPQQTDRTAQFGAVGHPPTYQNTQGPQGSQENQGPQGNQYTQGTPTFAPGAHQPTAPGTHPTPAPAKKPGKAKKILLAAALVVAIGAGAGAAVYFMGNKDADKGSTASDKPASTPSATQESTPSEDATTPAPDAPASDEGGTPTPAPPETATYTEIFKNKPLTLRTPNSLSSTDVDFDLPKTIVSGSMESDVRDLTVRDSEWDFASTMGKSAGVTAKECRTGAETNALPDSIGPREFGERGSVPKGTRLCMVTTDGNLALYEITTITPASESSDVPTVVGNLTLWKISQ